MLNKHSWVRLSNFEVVHYTGITRVTCHKNHILFGVTICVEFIFPEGTPQIFSFVKYNELKRGLIHPEI